MEDSILIREGAIDSLLSHALRSAKAHGKEVIGWLMGFFQEDGVCVSESIPCTNYKFQSRVGAEADPTQEAEVASLYPRNVGIVGLYHSHPFAMRQEGGHFRRISSLDDIFHSSTDDRMLRARSSRRKNYLSIVTNGIDYSCYVMKRGSKEIEPSLVREIPYKNSLQSYHGSFSVHLEKEMENVDLQDAIRKVSWELMDLAKTSLKQESLSIEKGTYNRRRNTSRQRSREYDQENLLSFTKGNDSIIGEAQISLSPVVYTALKDEKGIDSAMKDEILDNVAYLLWKLSISKAPTTGKKWSRVEIHLGNVEIDESESLPKKRFQTPEREITIKRS
ncbi:MAG: Mov34/MPN/PAD-1 family protein [Methanobacteriota archaeon]|nr:MAG: Mov34/MPN/PAD-1 family protein [Euryarchaeota archaeon]